MKLDTDVIQDRIFRLEEALAAKQFDPAVVYTELIAISREMLFVAEDLESRRLNGILPGGNVTF